MSFSNVINLSLWQFDLLHINSAKYPAWSPICVPYGGMWILACLQSLSIAFVHAAVLESMNSLEWLTVTWVYPNLLNELYAFQQSLWIMLPGAIHFFMIGISVLAFLLCTGIINIRCLLYFSRPPKTHCPSTLWPRWYLRLPNLLSSISTSTPLPPIGSLLSITA